MQIKFGSYIPNKSLVHQMDPRVKIFVTILMIFLVFLARYLATYTLMTAFVILLFLGAKLKPKRLLSLLRPVVFLMIFLFLINTVVQPVTRDTHVYFTWHFFTISDQIFAISIVVAIRVYIMIVMTTVLVSTTKPLELTQGIEDLMYPLKLVRFPVHIIAMIISIALRFIPTLIMEAERIIKAQASRGVDFKNGNLKAKVKSTITLVIPLFVSAFGKAEDLSNAMEARGYDPYGKRTRYRHYRPRLNDYLILLLFFGLLTLVVFTHGSLGSPTFLRIWSWPHWLHEGV